MDQWLLTALERFVPLPFLQDSVRLWFSAYQQAHNECRGMPWQVAHDFRGHRRRAIIEERWPALARQHQSDGVQVLYRPNRKRSSYFAQVACGRLLITQSCVDAPDTIVRRSEFRKTLARPNTRSMFDDEPILPNQPLYLLLIHGEDTPRRQPYFMDLVAPDRRCQSYVQRVRLSDLCRALWDSLAQTTEEEIVPDQASPQLRVDERREQA